jgi:hypothetical protein
MKGLTVLDVVVGILDDDGGCHVDRGRNFIWRNLSLSLSLNSSALSAAVRFKPSFASASPFGRGNDETTHPSLMQLIVFVTKHAHKGSHAN